MNYVSLGIDLEKSYGFGFDDYDVNKLPKLSAEDEQKWYSKFYYQGRAVLTDEQKKIFEKGNLMDLSKVVLPGDYDRLMLPGEIEGDLGYCLLENGVGYGATHTVMQGVSIEMYDWYKKLRMVDKLSYVIWYPGSHKCEVNGVTVEDVGFGVSNFDFISRLDPEMLGFSRSPAEVDPQYMCIIGGNSVIRNLEHPEIKPLVSCLFHYVRVLEDGSLDFRTHFFIGGMIIDGQLVRLQKIQPDICLELTRQLCSHCCYERGHVKDFLPELYARRDEFDLSAADGLVGDMAIVK